MPSINLGVDCTDNILKPASSIEEPQAPLDCPIDYQAQALEGNFLELMSPKGKLLVLLSTFLNQSLDLLVSRGLTCIKLCRCIKLPQQSVLRGSVHREIPPGKCFSASSCSIASIYCLALFSSGQMHPHLIWI